MAEVAAAVVTALALIGLSLPTGDLAAYAESISDGSEFRFTVR